MIIEELKISNFKNYPGINIFDLSVDGRKNIVLIGGLNGSGKTTLSEAIRLCLYGSKFPGKMLTEARYQEYLMSTWNRDRRSETDRFFIEMSVLINEGITSMSITIRREFLQCENGLSEKLSLTKDGRDVEIVDRNYWEYFIEKIMPPQISRYFFFDGEKIGDIIASVDSSRYLSNAVDDITGISSLKILKEDLHETKKRISRSSAKPNIKKKIKIYEDRISEIEKNNEMLLHEVERYKQNISEKIDIKNEIELDVRRALGVNESKLKSANQKINTLENELSFLNEEINTFAYSYLPFIISGKSLENTIATAIEENIHVSLSQSEIVITQILLDIQDSLKMSIPQSKLHIENIFSEAEEKLKHIVDKDAKRLVDITPIQISKMELFLDSSELKKFLESITEREEQQNRIEDLKKECMKFANHKMEGHVEEIKKMNEIIKAYNEKILKNEGIVEYNLDEIDKIKAHIKEEEKSAILSIRDRKAVDVIDQIILQIETRTKRIVKKSQETMEKEINYVYSLLRNKKDMVKNISIDSNYKIHLFDYSGREIDIPGISEGEKGILMYSVIYSLFKISNSKLPAIIDSPLGRMDSMHVNNLVNKLYPMLGEQVIILSHDREISGENLSLIEPAMAASFTISSNSPKISKGYFGVI